METHGTVFVLDWGAWPNKFSSLGGPARAAAQLSGNKKKRKRDGPLNLNLNLLVLTKNPSLRESPREGHNAAG